MNNFKNSFEINKKTIYRILLISHSLLTSFLFFGWLSNKKILLEILLVLLIIAISLWYLCNGCFLTKLERYLSNSSYTVIDPFLKKLGINISRNNRSKITTMLFFLSFTMTVYKLYF